MWAGLRITNKLWNINYIKLRKREMYLLDLWKGRWFYFEHQPSILWFAVIHYQQHMDFLLYSVLGMHVVIPLWRVSTFSLFYVISASLLEFMLYFCEFFTSHMVLVQYIGQVPCGLGGSQDLDRSPMLKSNVWDVLHNCRWVRAIVPHSNFWW